MVYFLFVRPCNLHFQLLKAYGYFAFLVHYQGPCNHCCILFIYQHPSCAHFLDIILPFKWLKNAQEYVP